MEKVILKTKRLVLRDFETEDFSDVFVYASDPLVCRFLPWGPVDDVNNSKQFIDKCLRERAEEPRKFYEFAIEYEKKVIGAVSLRNISFEHKRCEIGYLLNKDFWRKGIMTEASDKVMEFAFNELKVHRLFAVYDPENIASASTLAGLGFIKEAHFRKSVFIKGSYRDRILCAILEDDYATRKNLN